VRSESDVEFEAVDAGRVLGKMEDAGKGINTTILDACRNSPFCRSNIFRDFQQSGSIPFSWAIDESESLFESNFWVKLDSPSMHYDKGNIGAKQNRIEQSQLPAARFLSAPTKTV
jgi:hypothetical protein